MPRLVVIASACLLLSSCVAEMIKKDPPRKGPVAAVGYINLGSGEVRYSTDGWGWVVGLRRMEALRRIRDLCGKELRPKISDEFTHDDVEAAYDQDDVSDQLPRGVNHYQVSPYHHILFDCEVAKK